MVVVRCALYGPAGVGSNSLNITGKQGLSRPHGSSEWWVTSNLLYDAKEHFYSRDTSYLDKREANGNKIFWSRGNGWVIAGFDPKCWTEMPEELSQQGAAYVEQFRQMAEKLKSIQNAERLVAAGTSWLGSAYPLPGVSGSAFFVYALAWGINHGVLDRKVYLPVVEKGWAGLLTHVYADGRLGSIQPIGGGPDSYKPQTSYVFGVGSFLMAGGRDAKACGDPALSS